MNNYSEFDNQAIEIIRKNVRHQIKITTFLNDLPEYFVLDIAPQDHAGAKEFFQNATVKTLDIDPNSGADFIADICKNNQKLIKNNTFDYIICTEVLEHTLNPFKAVDEIYRMLKPGGGILITVPFNFRIHGPAPDAWRFTERGLKELFKKFDHVYIDFVPTDERRNMPICYTLRAMKPFKHEH